MPKLTKAQRSEIGKKAAATRAANAAAAAAADKPATEQAAAPIATDKRATDATRAARAIANAASGIERAATNFGAESNRDNAYTAFIGAVCRKTGRDTIGLADLQSHGKPAPTASNPGRTLNPFYTGSALSIDVGAINRQRDAGRVTITGSGDAMRITATDTGRALAVYTKHNI